MTDILSNFTERFEVNIKEGKFNEEDLRELESNRINILNSLAKIHNFKVLKANIYRIWNICRMLNYTRNIKDIDNNFFILRLKDICCDFFSFTLTISNQDININDIFNMMHYTTETSRVWSKQNLNLSYDGWMKKAEFIMKFLQTKVSDFEILLNVEQKFYLIFMDFAIFKLENLIQIYETNEILLQVPDREKHFEEISNLLFLLKNVKFNENENNYLNSFVNYLLKYIKLNENLTELKDPCLKLLEGVNSLKHKSCINSELLFEYYRNYTNLLIEYKQYDKADSIMNELFDHVSINTKEELNLYIIQLEVLSNINDINKFTEVLCVILEHKECNIESLTEILILCSNNNKYELFFSCFDKFLSKNLKNLKVSGYSNLNFTYDYLIDKVKFPFIYVYSFMKSKSFNSDDFKSSKNFNEVFIIISECLLDNYNKNLYDQDDYNEVIPDMLRNIILYFLNINSNDQNSNITSFSHFFIIEIIKKEKIRNDANILNKFLELAINIFLIKKQTQSMKNLISELETYQINCSLISYGKLLLLLTEGNKWNSTSEINKICLEMNKSSNFSIIFYLKLFQEIEELNISDLNVISPLLNNFGLLMYDLLSNNIDLEKNLENKEINWSLTSVFHDILEVCSKNKSFQKQILCVSDIFMKFADFLEYKVVYKITNGKYITNNYSDVLKIIDIFLNFNNNSTVKQLKNHNSNNNCSISLQEFPEFILIASCKLLHFVLINYERFLEDFIVSLSSTLEKEKCTFMIEIFELYKSLSIFYFSYELNYLKSNTDIKSEELQNVLFQIKSSFDIYNSTFDSSIQYFLNIVSKKGGEEFYLQLDKKIQGLVDKTKSIDQIFKLQLLIQLNLSNININISELEEFVINMLMTYTSNKKLIFLIISILFNSSMTVLCSTIITKVIETIFQSVNTIFTLEEICTLYRDNYKLKSNADLMVKVDWLFQFHSFIQKCLDNFDEGLLQDNHEWIFIQIYGFYEKGLLTKNSKEYVKVNQIFEEINLKKKSNKSFILTQLTDLILKKKLVK